MRRAVLLVLVVVVAVASPSSGQRAKKKAPPREAVVSGKRVGAWVKALEGKAVLTRVQAINALIQAGPEARPAVPALLATFRDRDAAFLHPLAAVCLARIGPDAVPHLEKALGDEVESVRGGSALALGLIGAPSRPAVPALGKALGDRSAVVRFAAAQALGRVGSLARPAVPALRKALADRDSAVRVESARALWLVAADTRNSLPVLTAGLRDPSASVVQAALGALGEMGPAGRPAAKELKALAQKAGDASRRLQAAEAWYRVSGDADALDVVEKALKDTDGEVRRAAVSVLGTMGSQARAVELLVIRMSDKDSLVRREAACALADRAVKVAPAGKVLRVRLHDPDVGVRWWSALALAASDNFTRRDEEEVLRALRLAFARVDEKETPPARLIQEVQGPGSSRAVAGLVEVLKERPARLRYEAARALGLLGLDARAAMTALAGALETDDRLVRRSAADALGQMGTEALPFLKRRLTNADPRVREGAARALGQMGVPARSALEELTAALQDSESTVRAQAALALWNVEQNAEAALRTLNLVLKDVDNKDRWEAIDAVGQISIEARPAIPGLTEVLLNGVKDRDWRVRVYAARWLLRRTRQPAKVLPLVREGLTERDPFVRLSTVETLGEMGAEGKIVGLMTTALEDRDVSVRLAAEEGLARGGADMVPQLIEALKHKSPRVRAGLVRALGLIGPAAGNSASKALLLLRKDSDAGVRMAVADALVSIHRNKPPEDRKALLELLEKLAELEKKVRDAKKE